MAIRVCAANLRSISPYSASRQRMASEVPFLEGESHAAYEARTWREKCYYDDAGHVIIPASQFAWAIKSTAAAARMKIPGKGNSEWGKKFLSGIIVVDGIPTEYTRETVPSWSGMMHADGKRGSGTRVERTFPVIPSWEGTLEVYVIDDEITEKIVEKVIERCGKLNGIGRYRPQNGGVNGRFAVDGFKWSTQD